MEVMKAEARETGRKRPREREAEGEESVSSRIVRHIWPESGVEPTTARDATAAGICTVQALAQA